MVSEIKIADEVWVACALLHIENPTSTSFSNTEILDRVKKEVIAEKLRVGVQWHINLHCVANKTANPDRNRMLYELPDGTKRLFKSSDCYHFSREEGKILPNVLELPEKYRYLLKWYKESYDTSTGQAIPITPVKPVTQTPTDPEISVTFTKFLNENEMIDFAYRCPNNIGSFDIRDGACKKCSYFLSEDKVKKALSKALTDSGWKVSKMAM